MEFFKQFRKYILVFIIFGLWSSLHDFKHKISLRIHSIVSLLIIFGIFLLTVYFRQFHNFTTISNTVANSLFIFVVVTHLIIIVESIWQRKAQRKLIKKFVLVDEMFKARFNMKMPYLKEQRQIFIIYLAILSIILPIEAAVTIHLYYNSHIDYLMFQSIYSMWIIRLRPMQVLFFVCLLRNRLNLINYKLNSVSNNVKMQGIHLNGRRDHGVATIFKGSSKTSSVYNTLLDLKQIYTELYNICELINIVFGYSLLAIMTQNFVDFTSNCYRVYLTAQSYEKLIIFTSLLIPNLTVLGIFTFFCSSCYHEV